MASASVAGSYSSKRLMNLAQQLRLQYQPPSCSLNNDGSSAAPGLTSTDCGGNGRGRRRASVLICLFEGENGDLRVILTKRASTLSSHSGEVSLPGGKMDEGDKDDVATALREAKEEIGLNPLLVDVVAVLDTISMKNGMVVVPVIGLLLNKSAFHPNLNADEVEEMFDAPLEMFLENKNRREEEREWNNDKYLLHFFDYEAANGSSYVIYALTAGILIEAASVVYQRSPSFSERRPGFWNRK